MSVLTNARVVAVGASAGGIQALQSLFLATPGDLGAAFVILQHLPPGSTSALPSLMACWNSMPVRAPRDGGLPEPNCIYIPSPADVLTLEQGMFRTRPFAEGQRRPGIDTIDAFIESLAQEQGSSAIAVILSGTGMDGCAGAARLRQKGGTVFVQDPATAQYEEMPLAVASRNLANYILPVGAIPEQLAACLSGADCMNPASDGSESTQSLDAILDLIRKQAGFDLRGYKPSPILWRVQERMNMRRVRTFDDYLALLQDSPAEVKTLVRSIPIHVTEFFRDPETWETLNREVLEPLVVGAATDIRAWTPACATGEEAYSTALLLAEQAQKRNDLGFRVFATDASPDIVARASHGFFSAGAVQSLSPERRARFFYAADGAFRVKRELRQSMIFAPQDLLCDPPFSDMDLVTCRNLLIYLEPDAARRVLVLLHSSLRTGGCLFLGRGEALPKSQEGFEAVSGIQHIYRKVGPISNGEISFPTHVRTGRHLTAAGVRAHPAVVEVPSVLIDAEFHILRRYGDTGGILRLPEGEPVSDLLGLAPPGLSDQIRLAVADALAGDSEITVHGIRNSATAGLSMNMRVTPVPAENGGPSRLIVSFIPAKSNGDLVPGSTLIATRSLIPGIRESHDSHQELQASREELAALNEELKTSNEQLNASYDSLNRSNAKLQEKIVELEMQSRVLSSGEVITLFVDAELAVRWFTPAICDLLPLRAQDVGRPITDIAPKFERKEFFENVRNVIRTGEPHEVEVRTTEGRWFLRRILPYFSGLQTTNGVAVTFAEITQRKEIEEALAERDLWLAGIRDALESVLSEATLKTALGVLVRAVTAALGPGNTHAAFYLAGEDGKTLHHVVGLPGELAQPPDGFKIDSEYPAATDGMRDPLCDPGHRWMSEKFNYLGCWSFPLRTIADKFVGVFAVYLRQPRPVMPRDRALTHLIIETAALIIAHYGVEEALRKTEAKVAVELADSQQLQRISSILIQEGNIDYLYKAILDAARALMRSDMARLQGLVPERNQLFLLAQQGFARESARFWEWVTANSATSCALVFSNGRPLVVPDVEKWDFAAGTQDLNHYRLSGIRAILSAPLLSRDGRLVGVISTHWRTIHHPSERELRLLDVLARQAADLIERSAATVALRESEQRQAFVLALSDTLRPLSDASAIKAAACRLLGEQLGVNRVFYADAENGDWLVAKGYEARIDPLPDVPYPMAAYSQWMNEGFRAGNRLIVREVASDSRFTEAEREAQRALQINAALAVPLVKNGSLLAILALHDRAPRDWTPLELALVDETAERTWAAVERAGAQAALSRNQERFARLMKAESVGVLFFGLDGRLTDANDAFQRMSGYTRDELRAITNWNIMTPPEYAEATAKAARELATEGRTAPYIKEHIRKDGSRWWGLFAPSRVSGTGTASECVEFIVDVTDQQRVVAALPVQALP